MNSGTRVLLFASWFVVLLCLLAVFLHFSSSADRIYFFNTCNSVCASDMILVVSGNRCGLIDASNRSVNTLESKDGETLVIEESMQLSNSERYKNGKTIAEYIIDSLGITHLDFIIGTHAHSDHIGGVPEIASLDYKGVRLVDSNTVYIYKPYVSVNEKEDNLWYNGSFAWQAVTTMRHASARLADVSTPLLAVNTIDQVSGLSDAVYCPESGYDDYIEFHMGSFTVRLYNLFSTSTSINENVNSIVTVIRKGRQTIVSLGDINVDQEVEQKVVHAIRKHVGTAALVKVAHHGYSNSNSIESAIALQPSYAIRTNKGGSTGAFAVYQSFCRHNYGTQFYNVADAERGICAIIRYFGIRILGIDGQDNTIRYTTVPVDSSVPPDGWAASQILYSEKDDDSTTMWVYYQHGEIKTGWLSIGGHRYYIDASGFMATGFRVIEGKTYYFATTDEGHYHGEMLTGWQKIDDARYFFSEDGSAVTGTKIIDGIKYFFDDFGVLTDYMQLAISP